MMPRPITQCRLCGGRHLETILQLGEQKLTGVFPTSPDQPVLGGPLDLVRCVPDGEKSCGLLQLRHSYPLDAMYGSNYGYRSGLNASMVLHLQQKAAALANLASLSNGDLVVDIGSNDGTLLKAFPPICTRTGIDPVARKFLDFYPPEIRVIPDFFSSSTWQSALGSHRARVITSIAMFYDIEDPLTFVQTIHDCLDEQGIWHFEQSYMPLMLERCAYDTICHEHIEYYALRQILWMLRRTGLKIIALETSNVNGGSLAVTAARQESSYPEATGAITRLITAERDAGFEDMAPFQKFRADVENHRVLLRETVAQFTRKGQRLHGYGASTKGNVLLQYCGFTPEDIPSIGEVNPEKFGKFTPGTGIPIVDEATLHASNPDALLVLPWHFRENLISREQSYLARGGRLLFPLPHVEFFPS